MIIGAIIGIDFIEGYRLLQAALGNQLAAGFDINRAVIAQAYGIRQCVGSQGIQYIAAMTGRDIQNVYRFACFTQFG
ncbi:Uncharacterised protein [Mycobacteroides abscessus subsp. massiliense]|nr:Uncharacterised protein [Mycobacteroides abscessus subsp. massiliense]